MAEIKIQRKQRSPWPWIIGIIILAAILWFILAYVYIPENIGNVRKGTDSTSSRIKYNFQVDTMNDVKEFISFLQESSRLENLKHYTENGLLKLQSALNYLSDRIESSDNSIIDKNIDSMDIAVAEIDTASTGYLSELKPAFSSALKVMDSIRKLKYPNLKPNILTLRDIENSIKTNSTVNTQSIKIRRFYLEAGNILQQMDPHYAYNLP